MSRIVHLSDLHFGTETPAVLTALGRAVHALAPDVVVVSGDLTQRARRREFAAARHFVASLPGLHVVVPGNHDIPLFNPLARALWPFKRYREAFGPTGTALVEHGRLRFVTVNSVRRERHADGRVTSARRHGVAALARSAPAGTLTIVVAHHPLGTTRPDGTVIEDRRTLEQWRRAGVRLVLGGHEHRAFLRRGGEPLPDRDSGAAPASGPPAEGEALWILNAGTALSRRLRHARPNSFNVVDVPEPSSRTLSGAPDEGLLLTIERHDFDAASGAFALGERRRIDSAEPPGEAGKTPG